MRAGKGLGVASGSLVESGPVEDKRTRLVFGPRGRLISTTDLSQIGHLTDITAKLLPTFRWWRGPSMITDEKIREQTACEAAQLLNEAVRQLVAPSLILDDLLKPWMDEDQPHFLRIAAVRNLCILSLYGIYAFLVL
jgi:hypothetical protein